MLSKAGANEGQFARESKHDLGQPAMALPHGPTSVALYASAFRSSFQKIVEIFDAKRAAWRAA
jgi:hypothetical protein